MPATSQQQQKLFGLALAFKRGEVPASEVSDEIKDIADRMSEKEIEDFAATKHKGLPKMKEQLRKIVREIMRERAIAEIELSKDDMDKLHSDGEVEVDGEKVTYEEGKKRFRQQDGIGKAKYTISYHDGKQKHKDGSDFFGIQIFKNKKDLETFRKSLLSKGYVEESVNEAQKVNPTSNKFLKGMKKIKVKGLGGYMPGVDYVYVDGDKYYFVDTDGDHMELKNTATIKQLHKLHGSSLGESINEAASRTAMEIGGLTGMNKDAIQKFVDDNKLDIEKVYQYVKNGKLPERMALVSAIAGKSGNAVQTKLIKKFK